MRTIALLVAAGRGSRFGGETPKQYLPLLGRPVLRHAAEALLRDGGVEALLPVVVAGEEAHVAALLAGLPCRPPVSGGATRQASVRAGLEALGADAPDIVLVHDSARPVVPHGTVRALLAALHAHPGAIPGLAVSDTLKHGAEGRITRTVPRDGLFRAQTPQAFRYDALLAAHRALTSDATDDAQVMEAAGQPVALVAGHDTNIKITWPEDLARVEAAMLARLIPRTGTGFASGVVAGSV